MVCFFLFFPFLRHIFRKFFQMKNSILVAVCSLAGVCASSAQAGMAQAGVYSLTTYRFDAPTGDTDVAREGLVERIRYRTDGYYSQYLAILLGAWVIPATSTSPGFYNFQIFTAADASALSNGSTLQFSNMYDGRVAPAFTSVGGTYSLSSFAQNSPSMFTTTFQNTASESWFAFITFSASPQIGGVNLFALYSPENELLGASSADLSAATEFTPVISTFSAVPAPGAVALLGLAGVFGVRRRRN